MKELSKKIILFLIPFILFFFLDVTQASSESQLKLIIVLIRHGDRTSFHYFPTIASSRNRVPGQLTGIGMRQEYNLGKQFRDELIAKNKLLSAQYIPGEIQARALALDRTLMSAQLFLMGLYPPGTGPFDSPMRFQPIPIFTTPIKQDALLHAGSQCPAADNYIKSHVYATVTWKNKEKKYQAQLKKWSAIAGENITLKNISTLEDPLNVALIHHWKIPTGFSKEDIHQIFYLYNWGKSTTYASQTIGRLLGGNLLKAIIDHIQNALHGNNNPKFILYSASDTNIMELMSAMGKPLMINPHYASYLEFKLYQDGTLSVIYNGIPVSFSECDTHCTVQQFQSDVKAGIPRNWQKECA